MANNKAFRLLSEPEQLSITMVGLLEIYKAPCNIDWGRNWGRIRRVKFRTLERYQQTHFSNETFKLRIDC